jgi:hypothetical protein
MSDLFWSGFVSAIAGSAIVAVIVGLWIKSYFGPYLTQKAKNLATHEDIQKLIDQVRETERVKAEISDSMWDRQSRWTYKRDLYVKIVETLTTLIALETTCRVAEELGLAAVESKEWGQNLTALMKLTSIASFVLSERANKILKNLRDTKTKAADEPWSQEQTDRLKAHLVILREEARKDLGYAASVDAASTVLQPSGP